MRKLAVMYLGWGERWQLGTLADDGEDLLFEYSAAALERGIEFSPYGLPLRPSAFGHFPAYLQRLPGLVADALPDGWGLQLMDRVLRKQGRAPTRVSPLERLALIGDGAMGALGFEPAEPLDVAAEDHDLLTLARAAHTMQVRGKDGDLLWQLMRTGGAPQGSRPKVLVQFEDAGTPWIVKFPAHGEHKEVCAIEHVYAELARGCGLDMPSTRHFDLDRRLAAFGAERFDRWQGMRLPVHTLAGALHADFRQPALDYRAYLRATRLMTRDVRQLRAAFARCVFNVVFHNRGDHARNVAFRLNREGHWELAPCYDLSFHPGPEGVHQMAVMGESAAPCGSDLLRLAVDAGLELGWAQAVVEEIAEHGALFTALAKTAPIRAASVKSITRAIEANRLRMLE